MTVSELIAELQEFDGNMPVANIDTYNYVVPIDCVEVCERAGKKFVRVYWRIVSFKRNLRHVRDVLNVNWYKYIKYC